MAATPEVRHTATPSGPASVEPPPPDLFGAAAAGAASAKASAPQTCCGKYLHFVPIIAILICIIVAAAANIAVQEGVELPLEKTIAPPTTPAPQTPIPPTTTTATPQPSG